MQWLTLTIGGISTSYQGPGDPGALAQALIRVERRTGLIPSIKMRDLVRLERRAMLYGEATHGHAKIERAEAEPPPIPARDLRVPQSWGRD